MREIRIRELKYDEARALLESELNRAFMDGEMRVHVLHGIGEGILKKMTLEVTESLDYARISPQQGMQYNPGITVIDILTADPSLIKRYMK